MRERFVSAIKKKEKKLHTPPLSDLTNNLHREEVNVSQSTVQRCLKLIHGGHTPSCKPLISSENRKASVEIAKKYSNKPQMFWKI